MTCEALDRAIERGMEQGLRKGCILTLVNLVRDGLLTVEQAASRVPPLAKECKILLAEATAQRDQAPAQRDQA